MRLVYPTSAEVDPEDLYVGAERPAPPGRPWLLLNMVASFDGAYRVDGVSGPLGGAPDKTVFGILRSVPDVILAGAGTVRAEGYGPVRMPDDRQASRTARGQAALPRLAVLSASLDLDPGSRFFSRPDRPPYVFTTTDADAARVEALDPVATVVRAGAGRVDVAAALAALAADGVRTVLCEGGPRLNGELVAADLVDEVCLTVDPTLVGGVHQGIVQGAPEVLRAMELAHVLVEQDVLLLRYVRPA